MVLSRIKVMNRAVFIHDFPVQHKKDVIKIGGKQCGSYSTKLASWQSR